jgi:hypothetical protein
MPLTRMAWSVHARPPASCKASLRMALSVTRSVPRRSRHVELAAALAAPHLRVVLPLGADPGLDGHAHRSARRASPAPRPARRRRRPRTYQTPARSLRGDVAVCRRRATPYKQRWWPCPSHVLLQHRRGHTGWPPCCGDSCSTGSPTRLIASTEYVLELYQHYCLTSSPADSRLNTVPEI